MGPAILEAIAVRGAVVAGWLLLELAIDTTVCSEDAVTWQLVQDFAGMALDSPLLSRDEFYSDLWGPVEFLQWSFC